jgi:lysophospholipase L1-like esterase
MLAPRTRRIARILLLGASFVVSLLFAELVVRFFRPQEAMSVDRGLYEPDPPRRYRLHPGYRGRITNHVEFSNEARVNSLGLRGEELPPPKPIGAPRSERELRVLALGDSFTFGVGASDGDCYPARLEARLRSHGFDAVVANAGAPGYGVPDEVAWYERWGPSIAPDVVVIAPFLANDLQDAAPDSAVRVVDGQLVVGDTKGGPRRWLYYHSHLFRLIKSSVLEGRLRRTIGLGETLATRERRAELDLYEAVPPRELAPGIDATDAAIARLARLAAERHQRVLAILVPSLPQVDPKQWRALHEQLGVTATGQDPRRPNRLFRELFERHGIQVLDPTDMLADKIAHGAWVYYERDQHLTPYGYDQLAQLVTGELYRSAGALQAPRAGT